MATGGDSQRPDRVLPAGTRAADTKIFSAWRSDEGVWSYQRPLSWAAVNGFNSGTQGLT